MHILAFCFSSLRITRLHTPIHPSHHIGLSTDSASQRHCNPQGNLAAKVSFPPRSQCGDVQSDLDSRCSSIIHICRLCSLPLPFFFLSSWDDLTLYLIIFLTSYDYFKAELLRRKFMDDNIYCHFTASFAAGTVATTVCSPADVLKARNIWPCPALVCRSSVILFFLPFQSRIMNASGPGSTVRPPRL